MSNPRVEEISDSDPEDMDPADFDPDEIMRPADAPAGSMAPRYAAARGEIMAGPPGAAGGPSGGPGGMPPGQRFPRPNPADQARQREKFKRWQCLYPIYFDSTRSRKDGRRVGKEHAVKNPLARELAEAVSSLGYQVALDPGKMHPKDWANPGRVKVLFSEDGKIQDPNTNNKHHLYIKVATWLKAHPTTADTPLKMPIAGLPSNKAPPPPNVPRGRKMGSILPMHSPALTGGGVSENMLKDMMAEMQGQGGLPGMPAMPAALQQEAASSGTSKKKEKKKQK